MAKKDKPPKRGDMSWMEAFMMPSRGQFQSYLRGQQGQFTPMIRTLRQQLAALRKSGDPTARAYQRMLAGLPTEEAVSGAYRGGLQNLQGFMQGLDMSRAGRGVSEALGAVGGALGVEGAQDIAQAAGTVSGVGEAGGDVMSKALMQAAAGQFAGLETERLGQLAGQRQELTLGLGEARKAAREQRQELARMLADVRGQRRAAAPNPFEVANMLMQFQQNRRAMMGGFGGYGGGGGAVTDTGNGDEVGATESEILRWLQSPTGGGYGVIGRGGLGSEGAARIERPTRPTRPRGSRTPNA